MEARLFTGDRAYVSTFEFHEHRERAAHSEQQAHQGRMSRAIDLLGEALQSFVDPVAEGVTISDLGCGDGGFLQRIHATFPQIQSWGYDFHPASQQGWRERSVKATALDLFNTDQPVNILAELGTIVVMTEVLEHLTDPHGVVRYLHDYPGVEMIVASSPYTETAESHDACHAWAWNHSGYGQLFADAGWTVQRHVTADMFQVVLAI